MGTDRGANVGLGRGECCDLGPSRSRASARGPRPDAPPLSGVPRRRDGADVRPSEPGLRPPEGDGLAGPYRAGRGALTPDAGDGPEVAADRLDPGGDLARRGPPPSGLRQAEDILVVLHG